MQKVLKISKDYIRINDDDEKVVYIEKRGALYQRDELLGVISSIN